MMIWTDPLWWSEIILYDDLDDLTGSFTMIWPDPLLSDLILYDDLNWPFMMIPTDHLWWSDPILYNDFKWSFTMILMIWTDPLQWSLLILYNDDWSDLSLYMLKKLPHRRDVSCLFSPLSYGISSVRKFNTFRPRINDRHFPDGIFKCIFLNENVWISLKISLKFVSRAQINNTPAFVQIMAWHRPGDKPLSEPMMISSLMHICVTRPQWVKKILCYNSMALWKPQKYKVQGPFSVSCSE